MALLKSTSTKKFTEELQRQMLVRISKLLLIFSAENSSASQTTGIVQSLEDYVRSSVMRPNATEVASKSGVVSDQHLPWCTPQAVKHTENQKISSITKINPDSVVRKSVNG